jgi:hypothetical protein
MGPEAFQQPPTARINSQLATISTLGSSVLFPGPWGVDPFRNFGGVAP